MAFTYDLSTNIGKVRLLIADADATPENHIFEDEEIATFLAIEAGADGVQYPRFAASLALLTIAQSELRIQKVITILDLQTSGDRVAKELRALAKEYREQETNMAAFEIIEMVPDVFAARERIYKEFIRTRF